MTFLRKTTIIIMQSLQGLYLLILSLYDVFKLLDLLLNSLFQLLYSTFIS